MLIESFCTGPFDTNAYLLGCEKQKKGIFIDPALGSKNLLLASMQKHHLQIKAIFLTHSHWDHIGDVASLKKSMDLPLYVHKDDAENVLNPGSDELPLMFPIEGAKVDDFLEEGQIYKIGNLEIEVLHTPGHSPGGVCFFLRKEQVLFSGDTLFKGTIGNLSLETAEKNAMWNSLKKLSKLPPKTRVYPGHGPNTTLENEDWLDRAQEIFSS